MEYYEDVIDAYESGVGVEPGESLTDYIKRNNINIIEMDTFRLKDSGRSKEANGGIMRNFYANGDEVEEFQEEDKKTREKTLAFCTKIPHKKWTRDFFSSRALKTSKTPS